MLTYHHLSDSGTCYYISLLAGTPSPNFLMVKLPRNDFLEYLGNYWTQKLQNLTQHSPRLSLHFHRKWRHQLLPVSRKSYKPVHLGVMFGWRFIDNGWTDSPKYYSFGNCCSMASFPLLQSVRHFCSLTQKMAIKRAYRRLRITRMALF